ncbi:MAG: putative DNA-binding domain-containing protein [Elusimicrobia bacterium]|nr:putative DNA-binding domain-containing protein [Elusimicrobiota bacterium]
MTSAFGEVNAAFTSCIEGGGKLSAAEAVGVYRNGYPARLSEALGETFEACWRMLGDEGFLEACQAYARKVPSTSHNLSDYGSSFPEFLHKRFGREAPFIRDLAVLEWEYKELFHEGSNKALTASALSVAVKENSVLKFGPAIRLLPSKHRVHHLWRRDRNDDTPLRRKDWEGGEITLLYKGGGTPVFSRVIAAPEASAIRSLMKGRQLGRALAAAKGLTAAAARNLFSFISSSGLVTGVS